MPLSCKNLLLVNWDVIVYLTIKPNILIITLLEGTVVSLKDVTPPIKDVAMKEIVNKF